MLELASSTVKVLGVFGRLSKEYEKYFDSIESRYSTKPEGNEYDIFRHLTLTFITDATICDINSQLKLLKDIKRFLPLKIKTIKAFVKNEESLNGAEHIAIEFNLSETKELIDCIKLYADDATVETWYIKVAWFVPKDIQNKVISELNSLEELEFTDFYLCANKQDDANTIFKSTDFN